MHLTLRSRVEQNQIGPKVAWLDHKLNVGFSIKMLTPSVETSF